MQSLVAAPRMCRLQHWLLLLVMVEAMRPRPSCIMLRARSMANTTAGHISCHYLPPMPLFDSSGHGWIRIFMATTMMRLWLVLGGVLRDFTMTTFVMPRLDFVVSQLHWQRQFSSRRKCSSRPCTRRQSFYQVLMQLVAS